MHVFAALVPPPDVLEHVASAVAGVRAPHVVSGASPTSGPRHAARKDKARWGRRQAPEPEGAAPPAPLLDLVPAIRMHLPITKFGNLAESDANRLAETIEREAAEWAPIQLGVAAGVAPPDDQAGGPLTIELDGDADALDRVVRGVPRIAQGLHLFVDRRVFTPYLTVGSANERTTPEYVAAVVEALDALTQVTWLQRNVSLLLNVGPTAEEPGLKSYREVPLGPG